MKKIIKDIWVIIWFIAMIFAGLALLGSIIEYNKTTDFYSEKVIAEKVEEIKEETDNISWLNTIETKITTMYIYEYTWEEETYQITKEMNNWKVMWHYLKYFTVGKEGKVVVFINPENPEQATFATYYITAYTIILISAYIFLIYRIDIIYNEKIRYPRRTEINKEEILCICPYCHSEKVGVKEVLKSESENNKKVWAYCMICGRTSKEVEVPLETSDDDIIELATTEWRNREKRLSLEELEALYLTRYTLEDNEEAVGDDVMHFLAWCRENAEILEPKSIEANNEENEMRD